MKSWYGFVGAAVAALVLFGQSAEAGPLHRRGDSRLTAVGIGAGAAGTATYFALRDWRWKNPPSAKVSDGGAMVISTFACAALSPIIGTVVMQRPLTMREVHVMSGDCLIPFIGGWLVNKAYDAHPEWEGKKPRRHRHRG